MILTITTLELKLPVDSLRAAQLPRTVMHYLLLEGQMTMPAVLAQLAPADQMWLVDKLIGDATECLLLAAQLTDSALRQRYWGQYGNLLGYLFPWYDQGTTYHGQLLAILRMVGRRYRPEQLTASQFTLLSTLTQRLRTERLYREDIFAVTHALRDGGLETLLDLSPADDAFVDAYQEELDRA